MTDTNLGAAAGDIFAKAFTLGYETGRTHIPAGGMALTAEQVEDVRLVLNKFGFNQVNPEVAEAVEAARRLRRALFPATEPAEDGWGDVNPNDPQGRTYRETAEEYYATPVTERKCCGYCNSTDATLLRSCTNCGAIENDPWTYAFSDGGPVTNTPPIPAPAEPAEEETKAEGPCEVRSPQGDTCSFPKPGHAGVHTWAWPDKKPASSPIVPAPTETGPWQDWPSLDAIPADVRTVWDKSGDEWRRRTNGGWKFRSPGGKWQQITLPLDDYIDYAPFTTAAVAVWDPELGTRNDWTLNEGAEQ